MTTLQDSDARTTREDREKFIRRIKTELVLNNFGLPPAKKYRNMGWTKALEIKALQELWVRMNLYITTGGRQDGEISYPEAQRKIKFHFDEKNTKNSRVTLKALVDKYYVRE